MVPNLVDPVTKSLEEVISWTNNVCAVIVPVNKALEPVMLLVTFKEPLIVELSSAMRPLRATNSFAILRP
jgi:hypothetical protein